MAPTVFLCNLCLGTALFLKNAKRNRSYLYSQKVGVHYLEAVYYPVFYVLSHESVRASDGKNCGCLSFRLGVHLFAALFQRHAEIISEHGGCP